MRQQYTRPTPAPKTPINRDVVMQTLRAVQVDLELLAAWLEAEQEPVMAERSIKTLAWFHAFMLAYELSVTRH